MHRLRFKFMLILFLRVYIETEALVIYIAMQQESCHLLTV